MQPHLNMTRRAALAIAALGMGACGLTTIGAAPASAQTAGFSAADYGKLDLRVRESLGGASRAIAQRGNVFEPVRTLDPVLPVTQLSRAIGRLDLLVEISGERGLSTCTASLVTHEIILTNHHCAYPENGRLLEVSFVLDFLTADDPNARRIGVQPTPLEADRQLDYALFQLGTAAPSDIAPVRLASQEARDRHGFSIVHHPAGQPKRLTRYQCGAKDPRARDRSLVHHTCETLPGSSGALLLDSSSLVAFGLHHSGGLTPNDTSSFNIATSMSHLLAHSDRLREIASRNAPTGGSTTVAADTPVVGHDGGSTTGHTGGGTGSDLTNAIIGGGNSGASEINSIIDGGSTN